MARVGGMAERKHDALDEQSAASMVRKSFKDAMPTGSYPGGVTHVDIFEISRDDLPFSVEGRRLGFRYGMILVDGYSRRWQVYALRTLAESEIALALQWYAQLLGTGAMHISHWILGSSFGRRSIHTDGGTSLMAASVERALAQLGFSSTITSAPDSPSSNGVAERAIRSLKVRPRALMTRAGGIPMHDWHFAAWHAVASRNRLASQRIAQAGERAEWRSPEELFFGVPATFKHHVAFGARCRVLLVGARAQALGTLRQRAVLGRVYLWGGHGLQVRGVFRYVLGYVVRCDDGTLLYSRDVWVDETDIVEGGFSSLGAAPQRAGVGTSDAARRTRQHDSLPEEAPDGRLPADEEHDWADTPDSAREDEDVDFDASERPSLSTGAAPTREPPGIAAAPMLGLPWFGALPRRGVPERAAAPTRELPESAAAPTRELPVVRDFADARAAVRVAFRPDRRGRRRGRDLT